MDILSETLTFEDGIKFKEYKCIKEHEDYTDKAFEELCCLEAGMCPFRAADEKEPFYWQSSRMLSSSLVSRDLTVPCPPPHPELDGDLGPLTLPTPGVTAPGTHPPLGSTPSPGAVSPAVSASGPPGPHSSIFLSISWMAPWTSPTSISASACVQSSFWALSSQGGFISGDALSRPTVLLSCLGWFLLWDVPESSPLSFPLPCPVSAVHVLGNTWALQTVGSSNPGWCCHFLSVCPFTSYFRSLNLSFLLRVRRIVLATQAYCED